MIFSFSNNLEENVDFSSPDTDIFCFFSHINSVQVPLECWHLAVATSLRIKREALILERPIKKFPDIDRSKRWLIGDGFLWLAPRALSVFSVAPIEFSDSYESMKKYLTSAK